MFRNLSYVLAFSAAVFFCQNVFADGPKEGKKEGQRPSKEEFMKKFDKKREWQN